MTSTTIPPSRVDRQAPRGHTRLTHSTPPDGCGPTPARVLGRQKLMVMQCTLPAHERLVPIEHYADLFSNQSAPERCRIAVARRGYESEAWPHQLFQAGAEWRTTPPRGPRPTREGYNAYRAVLGIGHAVFHLLGFYDPRREGNLRPGDLPAGFVEIAPSGSRVLWPPSPEVALTDVERLIRRGPSLIARPKRR